MPCAAAQPATIQPSPRRLADLGPCTSGAALVEFALVLPVLLTMLFGAWELGRAVAIHAAVDDAVRSGARYLARVPDPTCEPRCSWGAARAIEIARDRILARTGVSGRAVQVTPLADPPAGTVVLRAEVAVDFRLPSFVGLRNPWLFAAQQQEVRLAD